VSMSPNLHRHCGTSKRKSLAGQPQRATNRLKQGELMADSQDAIPVENG
jgi:hypothetical protein